MSSEPATLESDEELMRAYCLDASEASFRSLYGRYESRLFRFLQKRLPLSKPEAVSDLFQKTWLKVHASRTQFDPTRKFAPWFFTVALNTLRDHLGSAPVKTPFEEMNDEEQVHVEETSPLNQEQRLILKEEWALAEAALATLPGNQKEALLLSEWEGLSSKEIAEVIGTSEAAVRQLVSRARAKLRGLIKGGSHD